MGCLLKQGGGLYPRLRIGAVLLAAGEGRRMGGVAKSLITLQGVPLINRQLVALSGAGVDEVVVVTGHAREAVEACVQAFPVTIVHNVHYAQGQQGSVRLGLSALSGRFDAVLVVPADLPLIAADDLVELIGAFKKRPAGHVVVPVVGGQRGNPIVLDEVALDEILTSDTKLACRHLIDSRPGLVHVHETANSRFISDVDTLEDLHVLAARTGWRLELPVTLSEGASGAGAMPLGVAVAPHAAVDGTEE
jgi:molybdenum cofactor cytidylyltransferase